MENIAGVNAGTRFNVGGVIVGVLAVLAGFGALSVPNAASLGIVLILLGAAAIAGAPRQFVEVMNSGGGTIKFPVSVFERGRTLEFASRVSEAIARSPKGGRASDGYARPAPAQSDPTGALRQLEQLRNQGLITDAEFDAKRQEVLNRL